MIIEADIHTDSLITETLRIGSLNFPIPHNIQESSFLQYKNGQIQWVDKMNEDHIEFFSNGGLEYHSSSFRVNLSHSDLNGILSTSKGQNQ